MGFRNHATANAGFGGCGALSSLHIQRFPTVKALAEAHEQEVLARWSGLGYYNRARNLHKAAKFIEEELKGVLPKSAAEVSYDAGNWQLHGCGDSEHCAQ